MTPFVTCAEKYFHLFSPYSFSFFPVEMIWNNTDIRSLFLKLRSKLGIYQVVIAKPRKSPAEIRLLRQIMQRSPDNEKTDSKDEIFCLKWALDTISRKVF